MKTMSAIYQKVRHRLNDDWAYGNGKWKKRWILILPQSLDCKALGRGEGGVGA